MEEEQQAIGVLTLDILSEHYQLFLKRHTNAFWTDHYNREINIRSRYQNRQPKLHPQPRTDFSFRRRQFHLVHFQATLRSQLRGQCYYRSRFRLPS